MNLKYSITVGLAALCIFAASSLAQTKTTQLVVTNGTNVSKLTPSPLGLELNTALVLQSPTSSTTKLVLSIPVTSTTTYFTFPSTDGTLITSTSANAFTATQTFATTSAQGDALIASINAATVGVKIDAAHLDLSGVANVSVNNTLEYAGSLLGLDLDNPNNWDALQSLEATPAQGNNLIAAINAGNTAIDIARVNSATLALAATTVTASAPLTGSGTLGADLTLGLSTDASLDVVSGDLGIANSATAGSAIVTAINNADATGTINAMRLPNLDGHSGTLSVAKGGTGITSFGIGDLLIATAATTLAPLAASANAGYVLTSTGANSAPTWQAAPSAGSVVTNSTNTFTAVQQFNSNVKIGPSGTGTPIKRVLYSASAINFANTATGNSDTKTVTVTGAAVGDIVMLEVPDGEVEFGRMFNAWVSAADTVSVKFRNDTGGPENPQSDVFKIMVVGF